MTAIKDQAICLSTRKYSESSQVVTLFGREHGKIKALAKGSRRPKSRFGGGIEPLTCGNVIFSPASAEASLSSLIEFDLTESFAGLRNNLLTLHCAQYAGFLLGEFTEELDPHEELFDSFCDCLENWQGTDRPGELLLWFILTLLEKIGLGIQWQRCSACSRELPTRRRLYFSSSVGGLICPDCEPAVIEKKYIDPVILEIFRDPSRVSSAKSNQVVDALDLLNYHLREQLGKEPKIMIFTNQLLRQQLR
ncbi:MAG: DNA repair protein RecO [Sedimentisphaerales bacterium]|nr:DNA repair protein RecO [Sedimentisphaerales bacterium]